MPEYIYGIHPVENLLSRHQDRVEQIWIQRNLKSSRIGKLEEQAKACSLRVRYADRRQIDRLVSGAKHQGVVAQCAQKATLSFSEILSIPSQKGEDPFFLVLDRVEDPGNLGAVIRTAAAAGVHGIILPARGTAPLDGAAFKRSAGTLDIVPVTRVVNLVRSIKILKDKGIWVIGSSADADIPYTDTDLSGPVALVIGGETGVRRLIKETCDALISIPMKTGCESLNLSVAAGLLLYEVVRSRKK